MDPQCGLQDLVRCHLCETPEPSLHCDICNIHLCKYCEIEHIYFSDETSQHKVIPFQWRGCITKCQKHSTEICELYCEQCNIPICEQCASCLEHKGHDFVDVMKIIENMKNVIQRDLQELYKNIRPKYQEIAHYNAFQVAYLTQNSKVLKTAINKHAAELQKEIDTAMKKLTSTLEEMDSKHLTVLKKQEREIEHSFSEIEKGINELNKLLISKDVCLVSTYKSRNAEFRRLPPKLTVFLPTFSSHEINKEHLYQQFGSLSASSIKTEKQVYILDSPDVEESPIVRPFIDEPQIIAEIDTKPRHAGFRDFKALRSVSCLSDEQIWACWFDDNMLRLYSLQGELVKSIQTRSGNSPWDIAVTRGGDLVYTDKDERTVNIVRDKQIRTVIKLQDWVPRNICLTSSSDLLVLMVRVWWEKSDDDNNDPNDDDKEEGGKGEEKKEVLRLSGSEDKHTKVVRFSGSKEKQIIQYDDKGQPLYSHDGYSKYICENKNFDICVADSTACAVVVVNQAGKFRFNYKGPLFAIEESFYPRGITTDSHSRILIADHFRERIHIVDQDGQFLSYIDNIGFLTLYGLSVDTKDNLLVVNNCRSYKSVIKIQYYE